MTIAGSPSRFRTMARLYLYIFIILGGFFSQGFAREKELRLVSSQIEPYSYIAENQTFRGRGVVFDIVMEMAKKLDHSQRVDFFPWRRSQLIAESKEEKDGVGIFPLTRTPDREDHFQWVVPILEDAYVLFVKKTTSWRDLKSEEVKPLRIGVLRGTAGEKSLQKLGCLQLQVVETDEQSVRMLKMNRLDGWLVPYSAGNLYYKQTGLGLSDLRVAWKLMDMKIYLAMSKSVSHLEVERWRTAFNKVRQDGTYTIIMKKYGFKPLGI